MTRPKEVTKRQTRSLSGRLAVLVAALCVTSATVALLPAPASVAAGTGGATAAGSLGEAGLSARISRTEYGVPHVEARDFGGLGYGYGFAFAQDNACELADRVVTTRGERSRFFGPGEKSADGTRNLDSDTYYQGRRQAGTVRRLLDSGAPLGPTAELRRMVEGYAAGYNRYLRDTGTDRLPDPRCKGKPWARPITALDLWNLVYDVNGATGTIPLAPDIGSAKPPTAAGGSTAAAPRTPARPSAVAAEFGSNGWALGRDATRSGNAMVLGNPHLPWVGGLFRFYQVHLTIPGTLDVSGGSLYGTPLVAIGHNRTLAWTHTASDAQHGTFYALKLAPGDPTSYVVDGRTEPMKRSTVKVTVLGADGKLSTVERTLYTSRHGPVMAFGWTATTAYAFRDANAENLRSMNGWLAMAKARDLAGLRTAQQTYQGNPWTYTLAADTSGSTSFTDSSLVANLSDEQLKKCALPGTEDGPNALDGSTAGCDWRTDPDALVPGVVGPARQPRLERTDYVANSNNGPMYTNPAAPVTGIPGTYDTEARLGQRAQLGLRMIAERRAGTDGLGAPGFTGRTLRESMLGNRVLSAETGRDDVVGACRAHPRPTATDGTPVDVTRACDTLARWDTRADIRSRGAALWSAFYDQLRNAGRPYDWDRVPYDPAHPLTTPRGINGADARVPRALADAVQDFAARGIPVDAGTGVTQKWAGVPLPGCTGNKGCFNVVEASPGSGAGNPPGGAFGSTFLMATELTADGPRTHTLLTYGQSSNPASPHYSDQTRLFSRKQWVAERFTRAEIAAAPSLRVTELRG
ncbi:penicillin acylase family protein [Streptomyces sp. NPDC004111]|uniref:penicillin acylase family protein n=1 Tax=Streptomyces sp. NPDC004111 TaxID=3364690 RepID=UPI0036B5C170